MFTERTVYKNKPILVLRRELEDKMPFAFGLRKAKLILEAIEEIREFVRENEENKS